MGILNQLDDALFDERIDSPFGMSRMGGEVQHQGGSGAPLSRPDKMKASQARRAAEARERNIALRNAQLRHKQYGTQDPVKIQAMQEAKRRHEAQMHMNQMQQQNSPPPSQQEMELRRRMGQTLQGRQQLQRQGVRY